MTFLVLALLLIAAPVAVSLYLSRLPLAPACPYCHAVTGQRGPEDALDRVLAALAATAVRSCARCGWAGRMRWRLATQRAGGEPR